MLRLTPAHTFASRRCWGPGSGVGRGSGNIAVGRKKTVVAGKNSVVCETGTAASRRKTGLREKNTAGIGTRPAGSRTRTGFSEKISASEETNAVVFTPEPGVFGEEHRAFGSNTAVFVSGHPVIAMDPMSEETRTMVCTARAGVDRKNSMVVAKETVIDERKIGMGE
jgi:hypothetical protein